MSTDQTPRAHVIDIIKKRQQEWALRQKRTLDRDGYCGCAPSS